MQNDTKHFAFDVMHALTKQNTKTVISKYRKDQIVYSQGEPADAVFYVHRGKVKISVISERGREAVVALRGPDEFCGEGALTGNLQRLATMTAESPCEILRLEKDIITRLLRENEEFSNYFLPIF